MRADALARRAAGFRIGSGFRSDGEPPSTGSRPMLRTVLLASACLLAAAAGDDPQPALGRRQGGVERVERVIEPAGIGTLGRSNGALVAGNTRSDEGWIVI